MTSRKRVVVVDDTMSIGRFLQAALKTLDANLEVAIVPSAEEAVLEVGSSQVDLLITDINLPGISGIDLAHKIHTRFPETQIILITGMSDYPLESKASEVGAAAFFQKPLDTALFLQTASKCLNMSGRSLSIAAPTRPLPRQISETPSTVSPNTIPLTSVAPTSIPAVEIPPKIDLPGRLLQLRQCVDASFVILMSERGQIAAHAGDFPPQAFEQDWAALLLPAINAGVRFCQFLGNGPARDVMVFPAKDQVVVLASVGALGLVLSFRPGQFTRNLPVIFDEIQAVKPDLLDLLSDMGANVMVKESLILPAPIEPIPVPGAAGAVAGLPDDEKATAGLMDLLMQASKSPDQPEAEVFWDTAVQNEVNVKINPNVINFEQALRLGLAPDDVKLW